MTNDKFSVIFLLSIIRTFVGFCSILGQQLTNTKGCCFPTQFQSVIGSSGGMPAEDIPKINRRDKTLQFDFLNRRWAFRIRTVSDYDEWERDEVIWIEDYKKGTLTVAQEDCYTIPLPKTNMILPCIPEGAQLTDTYKMGAGNEILHYDVWEWDEDLVETNRTHYYVSVLHEDCLPLNDVSYHHEGRFLAVNNIGYLNISRKFPPDDILFNEPALYYKDCKEVETMPKKFWATPDIRFFQTRFRGR